MRAFMRERFLAVNLRLRRDVLVGGQLKHRTESETTAKAMGVELRTVQYNYEQYFGNAITKRHHSDT